MELIMQPTFSTCGQACIAMITGKSVGEVMEDMKTDGTTSIGQLIEIRDFYDNKYYDPEFGLIEGEYTHGKITSFLEIYAE
ncbi:MAG: hypothetical protein J6K53_03830 [Roseburia sp.]|nr:hypothetical protein [Roseburia sp.]